MVEYSSTPYLLFMLSEYVAIVLMCAMMTILFLGGWHTPIEVAPFTWVPPTLWLLIKIFLLVSIFVWVRATLPRMRVDRLMAFAWKFLIPLSIVNILIAATWFEIVLRPAAGWLTGRWWIGFGATAAMEVAAVLLIRALFHLDPAGAAGDDDAGSGLGTRAGFRW